MAVGNPPSTTAYIQHHLQNLVYGKLPAGFDRGVDGHSRILTEDTWTIAHGATEVSAMGFWAIHLDSMAWSIGLGLCFCFFFRMHAAKVAHEAPQGFTNFIELIVEFKQ